MENAEVNKKVNETDDEDGLASMSREFKELIGSLWRMEKVSLKVSKNLNEVFSSKNLKAKNPSKILEENDRIRKNVEFFEKENENLAKRIKVNTAFLIEMFNKQKSHEKDKKHILNDIQKLSTVLKEKGQEWAKRERELLEETGEKESLVRTIGLLSEKCGRKESQMEHLDAQLMQLEETFDAIKGQSNEYIRNNNCLKNENTKLLEENKTLKRQVQDLKKLMNEKSIEIKKAFDFHGLGFQLTHIKQEIDALKSELEKAKNEISSKNIEIDKLKKMLQEKETNYLSMEASGSTGDAYSCQRKSPDVSAVLQKLNADSQTIQTLSFQINQLKNELKNNEEKMLKQKQEFSVMLQAKENQLVKMKNVEKRSLSCKDLNFKNQFLQIHRDLSEEKKKVITLENTIQEKEKDFKLNLFLLNEKLVSSEKSNSQYLNYIKILQQSQGLAIKENCVLSSRTRI